MKDRQEQFYESIKKEMTMTLATEADNKITMRLVSPAYYNECILIFTGNTSKKYNQLKKNPNCCISIGNFFAQATAQFHGECMLEENKELRDAYSKKFPGAFDENMEFGGRKSEFIVFKPTIVSGWAFENDIPNEIGVPTIPFEFEIN